MNYQDLFNSLMKLSIETDTFYHKDFQLDAITYRIFNYRLANYTEFLLPGAVECRGIMFEVNDDNLIKLSSLPMAKFWNLNENSLTMNLDLSKIKRFMAKADGSLINSYLHRGTLRLKTKGSIDSEQCIMAMKWLNKPEYNSLSKIIHYYTANGHTCNLEWIGPANRIVLGYPHNCLRLLNIRKHEDGSYINLYSDQFDDIKNHIIESIIPADPIKFVNEIPNMKGIEGFVAQFNDGTNNISKPTFIKIKTAEYLALHHTKDSINSQRRLFECVLEEATDDLRSMFYDDPTAIKLIEDMEKFVEIEYNKLVLTIDNFLSTNKYLERKEFAIKGQKELPKKWFGLAMNKYLGKEISFKTWMKQNWKTYNIKDDGDGDGDGD